MLGFILKKLYEDAGGFLSPSLLLVLVVVLVLNLRVVGYAVLLRAGPTIPNLDHRFYRSDFFSASRPQHNALQNLFEDEDDDEYENEKTTLSVSNLRVGNGTIAVSAKQNGSRYTTTVSAPTGYKVELGYTIPPGTKPTSVTLGGTAGQRLAAPGVTLGRDELLLVRSVGMSSRSSGVSLRIPS